MKSVSEKNNVSLPEYIIGVGASAGGMEAIHDLFDNMPPKTGFGFVVIQHLSPDYKSLMAELLSKHTPMQVFEAEEGMLIMPNCVYVIPTKKMLTINKGRLHLNEKEKLRQPNTAVDIFFESLAADKGSKSVGIILSGSGTDGSRGIEAIKAQDGLVIVQDPISAGFDGMPNSAISTGLADLILTPDMIAEELMEYIRDRAELKTLRNVSQNDEPFLREILDTIDRVVQHDFTHYKKPTLYRRLAKRMSEINCPNLKDYSRHLEQHPEEIKTIVREFLINVTKFFRDTEAFEVLKNQLIPAIFDGKQPGENIKIWVAACSTGEEAYSIAILCHEHLQQHTFRDLNIKIFATDIDDEALEVASRGIYTPEAIKDISPQRLQQFFIHEAKMYQVSPLLRKMVVFARHDILRDPPFSRMDLISCRNMLIYIEPQVQKRALKKFHFALNLDGFFFMGPSEHIGILKDVMQEVERKWKIYKCISKTNDYPQESFLSGTENKTYAPNFFPVAGKAKNAMDDMSEIFKETLLELHRFTGIFIDKDFNVKQAIGAFKNFMHFQDGHFNLNLMKLVSPELAVPLGVCIRKAIAQNEKAVARNIKLYDVPEGRVVNIIVKPWLEQKKYLQGFLFIILEEVETTGKPTADVAPAEQHDLSHMESIERELRETRGNLQAIIEELESANEELQSQSEEIISTNEELQSTNEELQSLNEELYTVNAEHQSKIKELLELNDDLNNYFYNSNIGQILVDRKLKVRKFSPTATRMVNLIESDIGRSIIDITTRMHNLDFINDIKAVIQTARPLEKEVSLVAGQTFLMRITPYERRDKTIDGVVINFIDITEFKRLSTLLESVFNSSPNGITVKKAVRDADHRIVDFEYLKINDMAGQMMSLQPDTVGGKKMLHLRPDLGPDSFEVFKSVVETGQTIPFVARDEVNNKWYSIIPVKMLDGLVTTYTDISEQKNSTDIIQQSYENLKITTLQLESSNLQLERSNMDLLQFASVASHDLKEPLRKIQVFSNILESKAKHLLGEVEMGYLQKINFASKRMQVLIEDVLTLSKLSNSTLLRETTDLNETLRGIVDDLEIGIREKNARIEIDDLPTVEAVPGQMRQLFQNIIANSLKFNDKQAPIIQIKQAPVTREQSEEYSISPGDFVCITVRDNGIGFEDVYREKIFGLFQRLGGRNYEGTGIGLSIVKKIVENHGGFISAEGEPGEGAVFYILLPARKTNVPDKESAHEAITLDT